MAAHARSSSVSSQASTSSEALGSSVPALHSQIRTLKAQLAAKCDLDEELRTSLRRIAVLEEQLAQERTLREEEEAKVKDLRMRGEESRRAIMRLQGEASSNKVQANRRSLGPGALAGWNPPVDAAAAAGVAAAGEDEEGLARRQSKRASLAFGPTARADIASAGRTLLATGAGAGGHRRTASGGGGGGVASIVGAGVEESPAGGLRGLRLSGATLAPESNNGATASRRSSTQSIVSPLLPAADVPSPDAASASSIDYVGLAAPAPHRPLSASPAGSSFTSPIIEDDSESYATYGNDGTPTATARASGHFSLAQAQLVGSHTPAAAPRALAEAEGKLRAREAELERARKEARRLTLALDEANEAREASEVCLKALRQFIAEGASSPGASGDATGIKLPPLPTDRDADEGAAEANAKATPTWGAKLGSTFAGLRANNSNAVGSASTDTMPPPSRTSTATSTSALVAPETPSKAGTGSAPPTPGLSSLAGMFSRAKATTPSSEKPPSLPQQQQQAESSSSAASHRESVTSVRSDGSATGSAGGSTGSTALTDVETAPHPPTSTSTSTSTSAAASETPAAPLRGLSSWFSKRTSVSTTTPTPPLVDTLTSPPPGASLADRVERKRASVASPPFASLDHSQLHRAPTSEPARQSVSPSGGGNVPLPPIVEPGERARRVASRTESVGEDDGFVGPAFE